jgi:hypothetical protein
MPADDLTLQEAIEKIFYGAECRRCKEVRHVKLVRLVPVLGLNFKVRDIRRRLKCSKCGNKEIIVTTHWKASTTSQQLIANWIESD